MFSQSSRAVATVFIQHVTPRVINIVPMRESVEKEAQKVDKEHFQYELLIIPPIDKKSQRNLSMSCPHQENSDGRIQSVFD